jgi:hypothetical protein
MNIKSVKDNIINRFKKNNINEYEVLVSRTSILKIEADSKEEAEYLALKYPEDFNKIYDKVIALGGKYNGPIRVKDYEEIMDK